MEIQEAKFKKQFAGEYRIEGTYKGREVAIEASRQDNGDFSFRTYVDGFYVDGDRGWTLTYLKQIVRLSPQDFFTNI
jgi:hypothetical protein